MNIVTRHKEVLEEIKVSLARKQDLEKALNSERKHLDDLLKEESELNQQIQKESLFNTVSSDETI